MFHDDLEYAIQDFFLQVDDAIRELNQWWYEWGPAWLTWIGGGSSNFPVPPFAHFTYQAFVGANPRADEQSLIEAAEYWQSHAEQTIEITEEFVALTRALDSSLSGVAVPMVANQQATEIARGLTGLAQTQASIAVGLMQFAAHTIGAKAAYLSQVLLIMAELVVAIISALFTLGASLVVASARAINMAINIWRTLDKFIDLIRQVGFKGALRSLRPAPKPALALPRAHWPGMSGLLRSGAQGIRNVALAPGRWLSPSRVAGQRAAGQIQRAMIKEARQHGAGLVQIAQLGSRRMRTTIARSLTQQLRGRGPLTTPPRGVTSTQLNLANNAVRQAVDGGLTTWSVIRQGLIGYGVRSALIYGVSGWVIKETVTHATLWQLQVNDLWDRADQVPGIEVPRYRSRIGELAGSVVGAGLGGAPLALGATTPQMMLMGGIGGGLGYVGSRFTEALFDDNLSVWDLGREFSGLLRAGGADNLQEAIIQGALGGVWERYIGERGMDDVRAGFAELTYAASDIRGARDLSGMIGTLSMADLLNPAIGSLPSMSHTGAVPSVNSGASGAIPEAGRAVSSTTTHSGAASGAGTNSAGEKGEGAAATSTSDPPSPVEPRAPQSTSEASASTPAEASPPPAERQSDAPAPSPVAAPAPAGSPTGGDATSTPESASAAPVSESEAASPAPEPDPDRTRSAAPRIGDTHPGPTRHHAPPPRPDLSTVELADDQRQRLAHSLREQAVQAESDRQAAEEGRLRQLFRRTDHRPDLAEATTPVLSWSPDQFAEAVDAVLAQAAADSGRNTWKPIGDAWHAQGTYEGQRFTVEIGADGAVRAAYLGGFPETTTATAPDGTPLPDGADPSLATQGLSGLFHQLVDEGHATVDRDAGIVTFSLSDGSVLDVRFAVDAHAPEGHWYVQGGRHEFTPAGWQQREPVTIVLAGEVRTDQTAVVADLRRQVLQALSQVVAELPGPISARATSPGTGRTTGAVVAPPGTTWQSLPTTVHTPPPPESPSTTEAPDPAQLLAQTFQRFQAGELTLDTTGESPAPAPDTVVAISGDPASGIKLAYYADGSTVAFTVETAALPPGEVIVKPAQWVSDGQHWRQWNATQILVPETVTGDPATAAEQVASQVAAGLRAQHATLPGNDTPHQRFNRIALAQWQRAVQDGPVPINPRAVPPADPFQVVGERVPVDQVVPVVLGDDRIFVRFQFPTTSDEAQLTLPHLGLLDGQVWQLSPATITLPDLPPAARTWDHPLVRAALHQLQEAVAQVGPVNIDALRMEHTPASAPLARALADLRLGERALRPLLLADPLPATATGTEPAGPRYLVRIPGEVDLAGGAQTVLDGLRERGYQLEAVTDQWASTGEPGLVVTVRPPTEDGGTGEVVALRLLPPEGVVARQEVARQLEEQPRPPEEVRRLLDLYAGRQRPVGLAELVSRDTAPPSSDPYRIVADDQLPENGPYQQALNLDGLLDRYDQQGIPVTESLPIRGGESAPVLVVSDPSASLVWRYQQVAEEVTEVAARVAERGFGEETRAAVDQARDWARRLAEAGEAYLAERTEETRWQAWQEVAQEAESVIAGLRAEERRFATGAETQLATDRFTLPIRRSDGELAHRAQQLADALGRQVALRVTDPVGSTATRTFTPDPAATSETAASDSAPPGPDDPAPTAMPSSRVRVPVSPAVGAVRPEAARVEALLSQQLPELAVTGRIPGLVRADRRSDGSFQLEFADRTVTAQVRVRPDLPAGEAVVRPGLIEISGQLPAGNKGRLLNAVVVSRAVAEYHTLAPHLPVPVRLDLDRLFDHLPHPGARQEELVAAVADQARRPDGSLAPVVLSTGDPLARQHAFHHRLGEVLDALTRELHRLKADEPLPGRSRRVVDYQHKQARRLRAEVDRRRDLPARIRALETRVAQARQAWETGKDPTDARVWQTAQRQLDRLRKQWDRALRSGEELWSSVHDLARELTRLTGQDHTAQFVGLVPPPADPVRVAVAVARELKVPLRLEVRSAEGPIVYEIDAGGLVTATERSAAPTPVTSPTRLDLDELPAARTSTAVSTLVEAAVAALADRVEPGGVIQVSADPLAQRIARVEEVAELVRQLADEAWGPVNQALQRSEPGEQFDRLADVMASLGEVMARTTAVSQATVQLRQARQELIDLRRAADTQREPGADLRSQEQQARDAFDLALVRWRAAVHRLTALLPITYQVEQLVREELQTSLPVTLAGFDSRALEVVDSVATARELARQTETRVELTVTELDGTRTIHRFSPSEEGTTLGVGTPAQSSPAGSTSPSSPEEERSPVGDSEGRELPAGDNTRAGLLMGTAMEELPYLERLAEELNQRLLALGVDETVTPLELHELIQDKFRNAVSRDGAVHTFGQKHRRQFQIKVSLTEPRRVRSEVNPHAQIQANLGQGHWGRSGGQDRVNTSGLGLNLGQREETRYDPLGMIARFVPGLGGGGSVGLTQTFDTRQHVDATLGVADNRGQAVPTEVQVSYELTPLEVRDGEPDTPIRVGPVSGEPRTLRFAVPENFYHRLEAEDTVRRPETDWPSADNVPHWAMLEMTGRERLVEEVTRILTARGITVTESIRNNLRNHFWALQGDAATAAKALAGHRIPIVDDGEVVGWLGHRLEVLREHAQPVGKPSDTYRLEQVGVAFNRLNGGISASSNWNLGAEGGGFWVSGDGSFGRGRSGGFNAESTAIRVRVDKNREWNQFYRFGTPDTPGIRHQFQVFDAGDRLLGEGSVDGTMVVMLREADAYTYGLPVAREALGEDGTLRGTPVVPDGEQPVFPAHLRAEDGTGLGAGVGMVRNFVLFDPKGPTREVVLSEGESVQAGDPAPDRAPVRRDPHLAPDPSDPTSPAPERTAAQNILGERIKDLLRHTDFLLGGDSGMRVDEQDGWLRQQVFKLDERVQMVARLTRTLNEQELERQLTTAALQTRYDELAQGFIELTLYAPKWFSLAGAIPVIEFTERIIRVSLVQHVDRAVFRGYTEDRDNTHLTIGRQATGRSTGASRNRSLALKLKSLTLGGRNWGRDSSMDVANARHDVYLFDHGAGDAKVTGDDHGPHHHKIAVWEVPHTIRVEFVGQPESTFELSGQAEVSMPASFVHADRQPVPVTGLEVTGDDGTPVELFQYNSAVLTSLNAQGVTQAASDLVERLSQQVAATERAGDLAEAGASAVRRGQVRLPRLQRGLRWVAIANPMGEVRHAVNAVANVDRIMSEFTTSVIDDGTGRSEELAGNGLYGDQIFQTGLGPDVRYGIRVGTRLHDTHFLGIVNVGTTGRFTFRLASLFANAKYRGEWVTPELKTGLGSASQKFHRSITYTIGRIFGVERLPLNFEKRRYHFRTRISTYIDVTASGVGRRTGREVVRDGWVTWTLAESDAMDAYGRGLLALPATEVARSLQRWMEGDLTLKRVVAARAVRRLIEKTTDAGDEFGYRPLLAHLLSQYDDSEKKGVPKDGPRSEVLEGITQLIDRYPYDKLHRADITLPDYLSRDDLFALGFTGIEYLRQTSVKVDGKEKSATQVTQVLRELTDALTGGGVTRESGDAPASIGSVPGLSAAIGGVAGEAGIRAALDTMLDDTDGVVIAAGEIPHQLPAPEWLKAAARFPLVGERFEIVARARPAGPVTVTGEMANLGTEQQQYRYRQKIVKSERSSQINLATELLARFGWTGGSLGTARGWRMAVNEDWQRTTIRTQTNWSGATMAQVPIVVEFEIRRYPSRVRSVINRTLGQLHGAATGRPKTTRIEVTYDLGLHLPKGLVREKVDPVAQASEAGTLVPERAAAPGSRWRTLGNISWLPSRFGVDQAQTQPLREMTMGALAELLGPKRAEQFREAVNQQLSADAVPANLDRLANPYGYDVIPGLMLPSDQDVRVEARVALRFTVKEQRELAEDFGTGIIDRYQWMQELSWGRKRPAPFNLGQGGSKEDPDGLSPQADFLEKVGGGVSGGGQAGYGQSGARGLRMEKTSKETGPVVELVLQYHASVEAISYVDTDAQVPLAFEIKRVQRRDAATGYIHLRIYKRDLPELKKLLEEQPPWDYVTATGLDESVPSPMIPQVLAVREENAPELPLSEVLAQALDQESYAYDPGQALGSVIQEALPELRPNWLIRLTVDPLAHSRLVVDQLVTALQQAAARTEELAAATPRPEWDQVRKKLTEARTLAETIRERTAALAETHQRVAELEQRLAFNLSRNDDPEYQHRIRKSHHDSHQWKEAHRQNRRRYEEWRAALAAEHQLREAAAQADTLATRLTLGEPVFARPVYQSPIGELALLEVVREAAVALRVEIDLQMKRPVDHQPASHRFAPDGAWHRPDREQALTEELVEFTRRHRGPLHPGGEGEERPALDLRARVDRLRLDLDALFEKATRLGIPLGQLVVDARNLSAAEAAWAGVDVNQVYDEAEAQARAGKPVDRDALLRERAQENQREWRELAPAFHQALRAAGATPEQVSRAVAAGSDLRQIYLDAHRTTQDPVVALRQELRNPPSHSPALTEATEARPSLAELAGLFGMSGSPQEVDQFRALLAEAGLFRGRPQATAPDETSGPAAPSPAEAALLREVATELAVRHGLFDPAQRGQVLRFDPDWLESVVSYRPADLSGAELVLKSPPPLELSTEDQRALDDTVQQIVDRYYHGLSIDQAYRGPAALGSQEQAWIRWLVHRYGVPAAALYTSRLPGAQFRESLVDRDLRQDTGDPNLPSPRQQWFLNTTGRTTGWVAPGDDAFFHALFQSLPDTAREQLSQQFGITSARQLKLDLTDALREQLDTSPVGPLWRRASSPTSHIQRKNSLTSHIQRATALATLTAGGLVDNALYTQLPAVVAERYGWKVVVVSPSGEQEVVTPTAGTPVATVQMLRTGTHYLPVSPDHSPPSATGQPDPPDHQAPPPSPRTPEASSSSDSATPVPTRLIRLEQWGADSPSAQVVDALSRVVTTAREPVVSLTFDPVAAQLEEMTTAAARVKAVATEVRVAVQEARAQAVATASTTESLAATQAAGTAAEIADRIMAETASLQQARQRVTEAAAALRMVLDDPSATPEQITTAREAVQQAQQRVAVAHARWRIAVADRQEALAALDTATQFVQQQLATPLADNVDERQFPNPDQWGDPAMDPVQVAMETARRTGRVVRLTVIGDDGRGSEQMFTAQGEPVPRSEALITTVHDHAAAVRHWQRSARRHAQFRRQQVMPLLRRLDIDRTTLRDPDRVGLLAEQLLEDPATAELATELYDALVHERILAEAVKGARRATQLAALRRTLLEHFQVPPEGLLVGGPDDPQAPGELDGVGVVVEADGRIRLVVLDLDRGPGVWAGGRLWDRGSAPYLEYQLRLGHRLRQRLQERPELQAWIREAAAAGELTIDYQRLTPRRDGSVQLHPYHVSQRELARIVDRLPTAPTMAPSPDAPAHPDPVPTPPEPATEMRTEREQETAAGTEADADDTLAAAVDDFAQWLQERGELSQFTLERSDGRLLLRVQWPDGRASQARLVSDGRTFGLQPGVDEAGYPVVGLRPVTAHPVQRRLLVGMDLRPALTALRDQAEANAPREEE